MHIAMAELARLKRQLLQICNVILLHIIEERMAPNRIWQATMCVGALVCLATVLCAEPIKQLKPTGYVNDFAGVLDASSAESIRNICQQLDQKAKAQIAIVTIKSLDGADIEGYASDLYKAWGIGPKSSNRGVLIL